MSSTQEAASHVNSYPSSSEPLLASFSPDLNISRPRSQSPVRPVSNSGRFSSSSCNRRASTQYGTMPRLGSMFRRRPRDNDESPTLPTHNGHWRRGRSGRDRIQVQSYTMKKRPPFLEWLKISALDIVTLIIMAVLSYVLFTRDAAGHRTFPITFSQTTTSSPSITTQGSGDIVYPQFAHPYRPQIITSEQAGVMAIATPIIVFLLAQIRIRSFWDLNNSIFGVLYAVVGGTLFQVIIKWLIGGLRPNFLDVCQPDISRASRPGGNSTGLEGTGFGGIMYTFEICSAMDDGDKRRGVFNALQSFPSGHTTTSFAGFIFLYLYLNAKLKVFSNYHPSFWKLTLIYAPVLCATLIGGSLTVDQSHNWYDVVAGAIIGTVFAFSAYRTVFAAVWDWRINHIPLHREEPLILDGKTVGLRWTMTRRAGWGKPSRAPRGGPDKTLPPAPVTEARNRYSMSPGRTGEVVSPRETDPDAERGSAAAGPPPAPFASRPRSGSDMSIPRKAVGSGNSRNSRHISGEDMV
ncbi:hypothetical protein PgNI_11167 [Pyricularia grisea]|uniref:Phosphatidic acid phosphatase type 2/haloperoxidase domain-containing protein n=1 Tax=Pyricularia grisea TaxID=148305 RepID=A0A6P8APY2_PYRGI|nr:hypothetical protein PgNI_11167 [Pyricularia grisea]TLD04087.1 hypothetical protein PgNI_11167 [Pyricularia grisea]